MSYREMILIACTPLTPKKIICFCLFKQLGGVCALYWSTRRIGLRGDI
jgi:hypothetical protein